MVKSFLIIILTAGALLAQFPEDPNRKLPANYSSGTPDPRLNFLLPLAADPGGGCVNGQSYFNTATQVQRICSNGTWGNLASAVGIGSSFTINVLTTAGVVNDGVTDVSTPFQNALNTCTNGSIFATNRGCKVHVPMGSYRVCGLTYSDNNGPLELEGEGAGMFNQSQDSSNQYPGTTLFCDQNGVGIITIGNATTIGQAGPHIHDMNFVDKGNNTATLIKIQNLNHGVIDNVACAQKGTGAGNGICIQLHKSPAGNDVSWYEINHLVSHNGTNCSLIAVDQPDGDGGFTLENSDIESGVASASFPGVHITGPQAKVVHNKFDSGYAIVTSGFEGVISGNQFEKCILCIDVVDTNVHSNPGNGALNVIDGNSFLDSSTGGNCDVLIRIEAQVGTGSVDNFGRNIYGPGTTQCSPVDDLSGLTTRNHITFPQLNTNDFALTLTGFQVNATPRPATPVATVVGTTGAATYKYEIVAHAYPGDLGSIRSFESSGVTTGNGTLSSSNYVSVTWAKPLGSYCEDLYRSSISGNGQGLTTGKIASCLTDNTDFRDTGSVVGDGTSANNSDQGTGSISAAGPIIGGWFKGQGTGVTITSGFGSTPSIAGVDTAFRVTLGNPVGTSGVVAFKKPWAIAPVVVCQDETTNASVRATPTTSQVTLTQNAGTWVAADAISCTAIGF